MKLLRRCVSIEKIRVFKNDYRFFKIKILGRKKELINKIKKE